MSKFPTQKFYRNEYTDVGVDIISCTSLSNFYVHLKTRLRDLERLQERVDRLCIGISWKTAFLHEVTSRLFRCKFSEITDLAIGLDCVTKYTMESGIERQFLMSRVVELKFNLSTTEIPKFAIRSIWYTLRRMPSLLWISMVMARHTRVMKTWTSMGLSNF